MCAGESSLLLFFRFSLIQNDGAESDCAFLQFACRFLQLFACRLRFFPTFLVVNFFCSLYHHLSSSWRACYTLISLGRGLGDSDVAYSFHPWTYVSNRIYPFVFRWNCFSQNARCRCQVVSNVILHPPIHSNGFSAHLLSIVKVFAFVIEAGSFRRVGGARNCTLGFLLLP